MAYDFTTDEELLTAIKSIHARRCQECHDPSDITQSHFIDVEHPNRSLFLTAPMSKDEGGRQTCRAAVYKRTTDPDYQQVLGLVNRAVQRAWQNPRRDLAGLKTGHEVP